MPSSTSPDPARRVGVRELGHVVLYVRDLDTSRAFYGDLLGWPAVAEIELGGARAVAFSTGRTHHELLLIEVGPQATPVPRGRRLGLYHFGIKVGDTDDDLRATRQRLQDHDFTIVGASDHTITHSLYVSDPDGNESSTSTSPASTGPPTPTPSSPPSRPLRL